MRSVEQEHSSLVTVSISHNIAEQGNVQCVEHDSIGQVQNIHSKVMLFKLLMKTSVVETLHRMRFNFAGFILRGFAILHFLRL